MNLTAEQAYRILEWKSVYEGELARVDEDKELTMALIECLKDSVAPFREGPTTHHDMYMHLKNHKYDEYYGNDI